MWEQIESSFAASARRIATAIAGFLPGLLAFVIVVTLSLVVAVVARATVRRLLTGIALDQRVHRWGFTSASDWLPSGSAITLASRFAFWLVVVAGLLLGLTVFDAAAASAIAYRVLGYIPEVLAAGAIFVVGLFAARFLERSVLISAVNMQVHSARLLSLGVKWLVVVLATAMALQHLGIGGSLVIISFSILFGGIVLALALAVGLGSREMVSKTLEKRIRKDKEATTEDEVRHL